MQFNIKKILIVEDETLTGLDLSEKLTQLGYVPWPEIIRYGEKVLSAAQDSDTDVILMDIRLAGKTDGIEAAKQVKERLDIPIVFLTAFFDDETFYRALKTGPHAFLKKPVCIDELRIALEVGLNRAGIDRKLKKKEKSLKVIKDLDTLIPICSSCKKIRDEQGVWNTLEFYLEKFFQIRFTHSICSSCMIELYGKEEWFIKLKK